MVVVMRTCLLAVLRLRCLPGASRARGELGTGLAPLGFLVDRVLRHRAEAAQSPAPGVDDCGGELCSGGLAHDRHELARKAGQGAANADAAHVGAAANAVHPPPLRHIALDHRAPTAKLDKAVR